MEFLLHIPYDYLEADQLIRTTLSINLGKKEVERLEEVAMGAWNEAGSPTRGTLTLMRKPKPKSSASSPSKK